MTRVCLASSNFVTSSITYSVFSKRYGVIDITLARDASCSQREQVEHGPHLFGLDVVNTRAPEALTTAAPHDAGHAPLVPAGSRTRRALGWYTQEVDYDRPSQHRAPCWRPWSSHLLWWTVWPKIRICGGLYGTRLKKYYCCCWVSSMLGVSVTVPGGLCPASK